MDEGGIYPGPGLFRLPDNRMGVLYNAGTRRHNDPQPGRDAYQWALWEPDRLAGVRADKDGQFTIKLPFSGGPARPPEEGAGGPIRMNYRTERGGWIQAELIPAVEHNPPRRVAAIQGYSFDECGKLTGDSLDHLLVWKGQARLPAGYSAVFVRLRLHRAKIFAFMT